MIAIADNSFSGDCYIGIDTSNYTTSFAVCDSNGRIVLNLRRLLEVREGERGLRQSDAVFAHTKNMPVLTESAKQLLSQFKITAIGCSSRPRDAENSYMPCFLVGKSTAYAMSAALGVPVYEFSHQNGHIAAALYSAGMLDPVIGSYAESGREFKPFCAFHVSGGTTELLRVLPGNNKKLLDVQLIGGTNDLNAGQAIDRIGVAMGLKFPCGKQMELLSNEYSGDIPPIKVSVKGFSCDLSGLENKAKKLYNETKNMSLTSHYVFDFLSRTFVKITSNLLDMYPDSMIVYAGGVMSNKYLQKCLKERFDAYFAEPEFSADNASGTAQLCRLTHAMLSKS